MYASHVVSICHSDIFVLVFLLNIFCIVAYSYIYTQLAYRRGLPKQADGGGDRATNLQNLSTLEQTSRQPTIWIRQWRQRINFEATEHLDQTVAATYQLWSRHRGNRKSGSDGGGNVSTLEQTWRQPKNLDQTVAATYQLWSRHGGNRKIWIRPWRQLSCLRPSCVSFSCSAQLRCQIQPTGHS